MSVVDGGSSTSVEVDVLMLSRTEREYLILAIREYEKHLDHASEMTGLGKDLRTLGQGQDFVDELLRKLRQGSAR